MYYIFIFPFFLPFYIIKWCISFMGAFIYYVILITLATGAIMTLGSIALIAIIPIAIISCIYCLFKNVSAKNITSSETKWPDNADPFLYDAGLFVIEKDWASISLIRRVFKIDFNRASQIIETLKNWGVIGQKNSWGKCRVMMDTRTFKDYFERGYFNDGTTSETFDFHVNEFDHMTGNEFEIYCAELLTKNGYEDVTITPESGDFGADILARGKGIRYAIQCKCYSSDIGVDAVYQISGGMKYYNANIGIVLTNRYFTRQAQELAQNIGVILWNRDFLLQLIKSCEIE